MCPVCTLVRAPSWFFVSVADKGLSVSVSGLESTLTGWCVSVDSKGVCRRCGGGNCGRSEARRGPCLGQVGEKGARGSKCWKEEMGALVRLFGGGADEHGAEEPHSRPFEVPQGKRGELRVRVERGLVAGRRRKLETRLGRAEEPEPHGSQDRPLHAERIRRSWEAVDCAAVRLEEVASGGWRVTSWKEKQIPQASRPGRDKFRPELQRRNDNSREVRVVRVIRAVGVRQAGSGSRSYR